MPLPTVELAFHASEQDNEATERAVLQSAPRKDHRGVDLISDALPFGRLWQRARIVFDRRMSARST